MRIVFETGQNFAAFLAARLIFVTVLLGVGAFFRPPEAGLAPYALLFTVNTLLSFGAWEWYRSGRLVHLLKWMTLTLSVVLDTLVLLYTGHTATLFVFLYFFSVGAAGLLIGVAGGVWTAILSVAGMNWLAWLHGTGPGAEDPTRLWIYALNFALLAVLSASFHSWVRQRERAHRDTLGELEQTRLDTQVILDSLSTGVVVVDTERHVLYSNPSGRSVLGLFADAAPSDLEGKIQPGSIVGDAIWSDDASAEAEWTREIEMPVGKSLRIVGCHAAPLFSLTNDLRGHILLLSDLTPMKAAERAERERERLAAIGMLSRDLAHEVRNPLATVRGCVEMIRDVREPDDRRRFLELALKESDRLNDLMRDFLTFAQIETPKKQVINLAEFIRSRIPRESQALVITDHLPQQLDMAIDPDQMGLVVDALLLALAVWAEMRGEIRLEMGESGDGAILFKLIGKAVPPDYARAVFQPFSSVNRAGNGLALPTALRAVHAHGGELTLITEPGTGTWFDLKLKR